MGSISQFTMESSILCLLVVQLVHGYDFNMVPDVVSEMSMETMHSWKKILLQRAFELDMKKQAKQWHHSTSPDWPKMFPKFCAGKMQSPININSGMVKKVPIVDVIHLTEYDKPLPIRFQVNDHHVRLRPDAGISITGYDLIANLQWIDWHFGTQNDQGSEHTIDGRHFPLELQFFHKNYPTSNKFTAISCLFELSSSENPAIKQLLHHLEAYMIQNKTESFTFSLNKLLPDRKPFQDRYYLYSGSITWPPCTENVAWVVLQNYCSISQSQLLQLRTLFNTRDVNFARPTQILNGRVVKYSHGLSPSNTSSKKFTRSKLKQKFEANARDRQNSGLNRKSDGFMLLFVVLISCRYAKM